VIGAILLLLALAAFLAWALSSPTRTMIYSDTDPARRGETLVSRRYGLVGRPDYLIRTRAGVTPVEVKSRNCGAGGPYPGEKAQLYAYCLLAEEALGVTVREGVLQYGNGSRRVAFGARERRKIIGVLDDMRAAMRAERIARSHEEVRRCRACGVRASCGDAL